MSKIDVSQWGEFKVGDLFDVSGTKSTDAGHVNLISSGDAQFVGRTADNNGVQGYVNSSDFNFDPNEVNTISVSQVGTIIAQYRDYPYFTSQNILKLSSDNLNHNVATFVCSVINTRLAQLGFVGYNTLKQVVLQKLDIKLPITPDGKPDWNHMDNYIAELAARAHRDVSLLSNVKPKPHQITINDWKEFLVGDLFDIRPSKYVKVSGKAMTNAELFDDGNNPVIVNSSVNNGIGGYTSQDVTERGNVITYSDTTDGPETMFYQAKPFVGYSHVKVMESKDWVDDSAETLLYLSAIIRKALSLNDYDFTNKLTTQAMRNTKIQLPVDSNGQPNWSTMRSIVRNLAALSRKNVTSLRSDELAVFMGAWKEFQIGDLFERVSLSFHGNGARRDYINEVQDDIHQLPLLGAKKGNNGIVYYGDPTVFDSIDKCIGIVQNGAASAGLVYPEYDSFGVYTDAYAIKLKNGSELTNESILFVSTVLQKLLFSKYSYDNKCTWGKVKNDTIKLPVTMSGQPDFEYMESYIELLRNNAQKRLCDYQKMVS